ENRSTDYIKKRSEYGLINIAEYWIVDSKKQLVRLLINDEDEKGYTHIDFFKGENVVSQRFPGLIISVDLLLNPPIVQELINEEKRQFSLLSQNLEAANQRAESEKQRAESEKQRAESEKQRAESESQRAESEKQRAEKLASKLRELGIDADSI
ncbi:MAG TPA: Uma2 family endonuclease, partial [Allocoleopsis sp.]